MYLPDFSYYKPKTIDEAYKLLDANNRIAPIAGGTDLLVEMKQGVRSFESIMSLNCIEQLSQIEETENHINIGACVTHSSIIKSPVIGKYLPALADAVSKIGTHQVQNTGTIGGNLCTCASCADSAPILMVYDAKMEIGSTHQTRKINLTEFFVSHHITILKKDELLLKIIIPKPKPGFGAHFEKFGLRETASISVASVAVGLTVESDEVTRANIVVGACSPTPMIVPRAVAELTGCNVKHLAKGSLLLERVGTAAASDIVPIDDIRGSAEYRRRLVKILTQRAVLKAIENAG